MNAKNHYTVNRCVQVVSETNSSGSDIFADSSKTFSDDDSVFDASSQDSLGRVQQRYGAINRLENDSVEEPEQVQERIRLERIESAMKDEGAAVWSMQKARESLYLKDLPVVKSRSNFETKKEQVSYCKQKLRYIERLDAGKKDSFM